MCVSALSSRSQLATARPPIVARVCVNETLGLCCVCVDTSDHDNNEAGKSEADDAKEEDEEAARAILRTSISSDERDESDKSSRGCAAARVTARSPLRDRNSIATMKTTTTIEHGHLDFSGDFLCYESSSCVLRVGLCNVRVVAERRSFWSVDLVFGLIVSKIFKLHEPRCRRRRSTDHFVGSHDGHRASRFLSSSSRPLLRFSLLRGRRRSMSILVSMRVAFKKFWVCQAVKPPTQLELRNEAASST